MRRGIQTGEILDHGGTPDTSAENIGGREVFATAATKRKPAHGATRLDTQDWNAEPGAASIAHPRPP